MTFIPVYLIGLLLFLEIPTRPDIVGFCEFVFTFVGLFKYVSYKNVYWKNVSECACLTEMKYPNVINKSTTTSI